MTNQISAPVDVAAAPDNAQKTDSGIAYLMLRENPDGRIVTDSDWIKLHYTGWTTDGKQFDTSMGGEPAIFPLDQLIPGMKQALQLARVGESLRVWIPEELAYKGMKGAPQGTLVFEFEIIDIVTPVIPDMHPTQDATELDNGLFYVITKRGTGVDTIKPDDIVTLDTIGWQQNTALRIHSTIEIGKPVVGQPQNFFPGLKEVITRAHLGDSLTAWIPQEMGVDPSGRELRGALVFSVDILDVQPAPTVDTPEDVAEPPEDAEKTPSGLAYKVLHEGDGNVHPTAIDKVRVHYSGWTTNGNMFDSSILRGKPATFGLNQVIAGWTEGVQLMKKGDKYRFWIPEKLAYKGMPGTPQGMLVFDVELLDILSE